MASGNGPRGKAVCLPWATGALVRSLWGMGQAAVSGEQMRGAGARRTWELWFLQAEELVHGSGGSSEENSHRGLERKGRGEPRPSAAVWVPIGCSGGWPHIYSLFLYHGGGSLSWRLLLLWARAQGV